MLTSIIYPTSGLPPVTDFLPWLFLAATTLSLLAGSWCGCSRSGCTRLPHCRRRVSGG